MSKVDNMRLMGYMSPDDVEITVEDVLKKLKAELEIAEQTVRQATMNVRQLTVAIAAIERDLAAAEKAINDKRVTRKRGFLARAILDSIHNGVGTVAGIDKRLEQQGISSTRPSISNAIQRLQRSKTIIFNERTSEWVLREKCNSAPPVETSEAVN